MGKEPSSTISRSTSAVKRIVKPNCLIKPCPETCLIHIEIVPTAIKLILLTITYSRAIQDIDSARKTAARSKPTWTALKLAEACTGV